MKRMMILLSMAMICLSGVVDAKMPPVRIYLMVGQSNMQGKGGIEGEGSNTLRHLVENDPKEEFKSYLNGDGSWRERSDVWIHYDLYPFRELRMGPLKPGYGASSGQIGPEFGFGHVMGDASEGPILLIKAAWGGKSLGHNFLPPSVGRYPSPVEPDDPGYFYHRTLQLVAEVSENIAAIFPGYEGQGVEIAGLCWHQGWNDQYGGLDAQYETNLAAFIDDIRSVENGLGVPDLPIVIASSGMITNTSLVVQGQLAMGDARKYPQFKGNVGVINTDNPYGPDQMKFKFYMEGKPGKVGYHWNNHAHSYLNIGRAMAAEMLQLDKPELPARLIAHGCDKGVQLLWQLGRTKPEGIEILRNGKRMDVRLSPAQTAFVDEVADPGLNQYELLLTLPSGEQKFRVSCDTSTTELTAYRSMQGVMLSWKARGKYEGFRISRDGTVIADGLAAHIRSFEDKDAPAKGKVNYAVEPTTGEVTPSELVVNRGPLDSRGAIVYEPFDYPASIKEPQSVLGKGGAIGTKGTYFYMSDQKLERAPATLPQGLGYGTLPVTGNRGSTHRWNAEACIELDDTLRKSGLLDDGATLWMSYVFAAGEEVFAGQNHVHRNGGGMVTLRSENMMEGLGFKGSGRQYETVVVLDGKVKAVRITGTRPNTPTLVVGRIVWGKNGENDSFVPFHVGPDLKLPESEGRHATPFNIDQGKLSRLVLSGEGQFDEIRVGPNFESVVGGGNE